jgi:putative transposase
MNIYKRHRYPPDIIQYAVWVYFRFSLSFRDVEDLLAERGITVSYETIRYWCNKFGRIYSKRLKKSASRFGDTWFMDEVFINIRGERHYLWRAVDQDGDVIDILVQKRRDGKAAKRFFKRLLTSNQGVKPWKVVTDKLRSYDVAHRELVPKSIHDNIKYHNNRAESSHESTRVRERQMRKFKSRAHAQRFLSMFSLVYNVFNSQRHLCSAALYNSRRSEAFTTWRNITAS